MADFTDVANTLVGIIVGVVYPNGTGQPSVAGVDIKVFQGWPITDDLQKALSKGKIQISVFPLPTEKQTPMRMADWQTLSIAAPTVIAVASGLTVTFSGAGGANQNALVLVDRKPYVYAVQPSDTPTQIAAALAALIATDRAASSTGTVLTVPGSHSLIPRIGTSGTSIRELRRQEKTFQITVWADCFDKRDPVASIVDAALAAITRMGLPDGTQGTLRYKSSNQVDALQKTGIYRRDLMYTVEYATTQTRTDVQVVTDQIAMSAYLLPDGNAIGQIVTNY